MTQKLVLHMTQKLSSFQTRELRVTLEISSYDSKTREFYTREF